MGNNATPWASGNVGPSAPPGLRTKGRKQLSEPGDIQAVWVVGPVTCDGCRGWGTGVESPGSEGGRGGGRASRCGNGDVQRKASWVGGGPHTSGSVGLTRRCLDLGRWGWSGVGVFQGVKLDSFEPRLGRPIGATLTGFNLDREKPRMALKQLNASVVLVSPPPQSWLCIRLSLGAEGP